MTKPDAELAVMVELPMVTMAGAVVVGVVATPPAVDEASMAPGEVDAPVPGLTAAGEVDSPVPGLTATGEVDSPVPGLTAAGDVDSPVPGSTAPGDVDVPVPGSTATDVDCPVPGSTAPGELDVAGSDGVELCVEAGWTGALVAVVGSSVAVLVGATVGALGVGPVEATLGDVVSN